MKRYELHLGINAERYLSYYRGTVKQVVARSTNGEMIQFPASLLAQFVTQTGIYGRFLLTCDDNNRNAKLQKLP